MLKTPEEYPPENTLICRKFTNSRTLLKSITRPLQGGGRWFEPSIAHLEITWKWRYFERAQAGQGALLALLLQPCCNPSEVALTIVLLPSHRRRSLACRGVRESKCSG